MPRITTLSALLLLMPISVEAPPEPVEGKGPRGWIQRPDTLVFFGPELVTEGPRNLSNRTSGWIPLSLDDLPMGRTEVSTRLDRSCVLARTEGSVVAMGRLVDAVPGGDAELTWSWFLEEGIPDSSLTSESGDDYGARLLVNFAFEPDREGPLARLGHALGGSRFGVEAPGSSLSYVWSRSHAFGRTAWNPHSDRVATVVIADSTVAGGDDARWVTHTRHVGGDYRTIFGREAPAITSIVLFSDSDDTGGTTSVCFGDVVLERAPSR